MTRTDSPRAGSTATHRLPSLNDAGFPGVYTYIQERPRCCSPTEWASKVGSRPRGDCQGDDRVHRERRLRRVGRDKCTRRVSSDSSLTCQGQGPHLNPLLRDARVAVLDSSYYWAPGASGHTPRVSNVLDNGPASIRLKRFLNARSVLPPILRMDPSSSLADVPPTKRATQQGIRSRCRASFRLLNYRSKAWLDLEVSRTPRLAPLHQGCANVSEHFTIRLTIAMRSE
jgi:hypothetical protein